MTCDLRHHAVTLLLAAALLAPGCDRTGHDAVPSRSATAHDHADHEDHADHDHPEGGEESTVGARFQPGEGVVLSSATRKILEVKLADVVVASLPPEVRFTAQLFGEQHRHLPNPEDHSGCDVHGAGLLAESAATRLAKGDAVEVRHPTHGSLHGVILGLQKAPALGEFEVIIGISNAIALLRPGEFVPAFAHPRPGEATATLPREALLRTAEGTFVYVSRGDAFLRTPVKTGAEHDGRVAITDGLPADARVVTHPVETLWLVELRATKGGGHSH